MSEAALPSPKGSGQVSQDHRSETPPSSFASLFSGARLCRTATGSTIGDLALVVVSGLAMWAAFPALNWWFLVVPSLALLVAVVDRVGPWRAAGYSAVWAMTFMMPLISWMQIATGNTWIAWFALAGAQAFFIALWGGTFASTRVWPWARSVWGEALVGSLLWITWEEIRSRIPFGGFPWGKVAYPQVNSSLIGLAPYGGEILVAFAVVGSAILLRRALALRGNPRSSPSTKTRVIAVVTAIAVLVLPGFITLPVQAENGTVDVAVIQGNVEIPMLETFAIPRKVTGNHARQSMVMLDEGHEVDLIFWGENSTDLDPRVDSGTTDLVEEVVERAGVPVMIGVMEYHSERRYNWMVVWDPEDGGLWEEKYGKQHPVPWGEYVPFRTLTEWLAEASAQVSVDMVAVDNPAFMEVRLSDGRVVPLVVAICFEVAYEPLIAEGVRLGGEMIVIPTNNAHFQNSPESDQQLQMAQFRAAQFSRATMQVSTNGVSALVSPNGEVMEKTGTQEAAHLVGQMPLRTSMTPSALLTPFLPALVMGAGLMVGAVAMGAHIKMWRSERRSFAYKHG